LLKRFKVLWVTQWLQTAEISSRRRSIPAEFLGQIATPGEKILIHQLDEARIAKSSPRTFCAVAFTTLLTRIRGASL